jgi:hypothetical protein
MNINYIRISFDIEIAKKIINGKIKGKIITREGQDVRILCFDAKGDNPIVALVKKANNTEEVVTYPEDGCIFKQGVSTLDLKLEVPEYVTFKDGDFYKTESGSIAIYNGNYQTVRNTVPYYVGLRKSDNRLVFEDKNCGFGIFEECSSKVTVAEKQELINALIKSDNIKAGEYLKRFFGIIKDHNFKPFDKVLVRNPNDVWYIAFYSHYKNDESKYHYVTAGGAIWEYCIPYSDSLSYIIGTKTEFNEIKW